jgi:type II secretion system (T2SS) protein G
MTQTMAYPQYVMVPVRESNGLGVAGFFIALIGLFVPTGIVALLGLLISLVALSRAPRGFATMGVLVGLFGTVIWIAITGVAVLGALILGVSVLFAAIAAFILTQPETIKVTSDMANVALAAMEYQDQNGALPQDLSVLGLKPSQLTDPWGNPYRYQIVVEDPGFDVVSAGDDGIAGSADDLALSRLGEMWEAAGKRFGEGIEQLGDRLERLDHRRTHYRRTFSTRHWLPELGASSRAAADSD